MVGSRFGLRSLSTRSGREASASKPVTASCPHCRWRLRRRLPAPGRRTKGPRYTRPTGLSRHRERCGDRPTDYRQVDARFGSAATKVNRSRGRAAQPRCPRESRQTKQAQTKPRPNAGAPACACDLMHDLAKAAAETTMLPTRAGASAGTRLTRVAHARSGSDTSSTRSTWSPPGMAVRT
jgi:hypothetical protein